VDGREGQGPGIGRRGADQEIGVPEGNIIVALQSRIIHHPAMRKLADTGMFEGKQIKALAIGGPIVAVAGSVNVHSVASVAQNEIAPLTVRRGLIGNWIASSIVAGAENYGANGIDDAPGSDDDINFGDGGDHIINNLPDSIAKIASITIKGVIAGAFLLDERFGIVSHAVGSLKISGTSVPIVDFNPLGLFQGVTLHLV
jgi:hypothetical protein